jgi:hypothetical protein
MTDSATELEQLREEATGIAKDLRARNANLGMSELVDRVADLADLVAALAHHAAGEIRNRRLATDTP